MASIQYLTEIAGGKAAIFEQAAADPKIARKRKPDLDQVTIAVLKVVEQRSIAGAVDLVRDDLQDALDTYLLTAGDRFMADDPDEWDSGLDDKVEEVFKPYNDVLSSDFLATATIDSGLHVANGVITVANKFGKEVYKQLCWQAGDRDRPGKIKQPMQILSSASILTSDILGYFADRIEQPINNAPVVPDAQQEKVEAMQLDIAINQLRLWMLDNFVTAIDPEMLGNLIDSDDVIAQGAATQLGLPADAALSFQMLAFDKGDGGAVEYVQEQLALDYVYQSESGHLVHGVTDPVYDTSIPPPPAVASTPKAAKGDGPRMNDVLKILKDHGGTSINDMASLAGVSRGTYNNYLNDKTDWTPDDEAKGRVFAVIEEHMHAMMNARALLEGAN